MNTQFFIDLLNDYIVYGVMALDALWGLYCILVVYMRIAQKRFRTNARQDEWLDALDQPLRRGEFAAAAELCEGDRRAIPQLAAIACAHSHLETEQVQELLVDRLQRDVLSDLEHRVSWINNVIKTAPMLGLLGTVLGMMAAFGKLASQKNVNPADLAENISFALITTAIGLGIAIPATVCVASINVRIRKLEEQVGSGLVRLLDSFAAGKHATRSK
ncbi:MAG: MotA/TolQ/ExbB proton channel family protein [Pirellulaceae bacterium]|nr:MotA/TolQ/ExbB proton channel family protein [Pirellulaceae bacterium]